jgi:hypothetical protein
MERLKCISIYAPHLNELRLDCVQQAKRCLVYNMKIRSS